MAERETFTSADPEASQDSAAAAEEASAIASAKGYKAPHRRTTRASKRLGDQEQGPTRLDRVRENARKPVKGVDSVRDRVPSIDRFHLDADEVRAYGGNPDTERPYFCNSEETDRRLGNASRARIVMQRGGRPALDSSGNPIYEGGTQLFFIPRELDNIRDERTEDRRDEIDAEIEVARRAAEGGTSAEEKQQIADMARRNSIIGSDSVTRGLTLEEAWDRVPKDVRDRVHHKALFRSPMADSAPAQEREPRRSSSGGRKYFDMGRRG